MLTSDVKLSLIRQIADLPENLLLEAQATLNELLSKRKNGLEKPKVLSYEERLKIINEAAKHLTVKENFEAYVRDFEESRQERPLPFRED